MQFSIQSPRTKPDAVTSFALRELRQYLGKTKHSGEAPSMITLIVLDQSADILPSHPLHDGYYLDWSASRLTLSATKPKGLLNGVYDVLQLLGFSFPFPGMDRHPSEQNWSAVKANANGQWYVPSFCHRILHFDNMRLTSDMIDWVAKLKINMIQEPLHVYRKDVGVKPELAEMVQERGLELNVGGHGFDNWLPPSKYGKEHPEWYSQSHAVQKGIFMDPRDDVVPAEFSGGQICLSNQEVICEFAKNVVAYLKKHPEIGTVSLWPNDGIAGWCVCENCLALEPAPDKPDPQTGTPSRITSYLWFIQQVGDLIHKELPKARIDFAAFYDFATPPDNTQVVPASDEYMGFLVDDYFGCLLHGHGERWNRKRIEQAHRRWREVFSHEIYAVGYYSDLCKIMDVPIVFTTKIRDDFSYLKEEISIDSVMTLVVCAELDYLLDFCFQNIYSFATLGWDHRATSEDVLRSLSEAISPSSADDVFQYLHILDSLGQNNPEKHAGWIWLTRKESTLGDWSEQSHQMGIGEIISQETLASLRQRINSAIAKASSDDMSTQILNRMQCAFHILELMLEYDPQNSADSQLAVLDEIAQAVKRRGEFPAAVVPSLERLRRQAQQG